VKTNTRKGRAGHVCGEHKCKRCKVWHSKLTLKKIFIFYFRSRTPMLCGASGAKRQQLSLPLDRL
jgi:hypothetical protein